MSQAALLRCRFAATAAFAAVLFNPTAAPVFAQQALSQVFRSGVAVVPLAVTVEKADGSFVQNLGAGQFRVFDQGVAKPLAFFSTATVPVDLVLMLDTSGSMGARIPAAKRAAADFVAALGPQDRAAIVTFGTRVRTVQPLTDDRQSVIAAINGLTTGGDTTLYDSLYVALKTAARSSDGRIRRQARSSSPTATTPAACSRTTSCATKPGPAAPSGDREMLLLCRLPAAKYRRHAPAFRSREADGALRAPDTR